MVAGLPIGYSIFRLQLSQYVIHKLYFGEVVDSSYWTRRELRGRHIGRGRELREGHLGGCRELRGGHLGSKMATRPEPVCKMATSEENARKMVQGRTHLVCVS
ncbi:hypothetical protein E1301_Tti015663 [Triplophysa tibetana]|uniref:Uncharacterized protein n=1 Tax=Triplophysa tibetana TaxID=1572043 RepID=A0A5A9PPC8_9TELE|nr:hypothetical protein E1301_Tti015663 [Triplophysa tibetana]